jgi:hydrogenase expression/formation protein HypC
MKIVNIKDDKGIVDINGVQRQIGLHFIEDVEIGDYIIVHAGYAIQKLDEKEALETLTLFDELERLGEVH